MVWLVSEVLLLSDLAAFCFDSRSQWFNVTFSTCTVIDMDELPKQDASLGILSEQPASFLFSSLGETGTVWVVQEGAAVEGEVTIQYLKTALTCMSQLWDNSSPSPTIFFPFSLPSFILLDYLSLIFNPVLSQQNAEELLWCFWVGTASIFKLPSVFTLVNSECLTLQLLKADSPACHYFLQCQTQFHYGAINGRCWMAPENPVLVLSTMWHCPCARPQLIGENKTFSKTRIQLVSYTGRLMHRHLSPSYRQRVWKKEQ